MPLAPCLPSSSRQKASGDRSNFLYDSSRARRLAHNTLSIQTIMRIPGRRPCAGICVCVCAHARARWVSWLGRSVCGGHTKVVFADVQYAVYVEVRMQSVQAFAPAGDCAAIVALCLQEYGFRHLDSASHLSPVWLLPLQKDRICGARWANPRQQVARASSSAPCCRRSELQGMQHACFQHNRCLQFSAASEPFRKSSRSLTSCPSLCTEAEGVQWGPSIPTAPVLRGPD